MIRWTEKDIKRIVDLVKKNLSNGWSLRVCFSKAGVNVRKEYLIRPHLEAEIKKYKSKYPAYSGVETTIV
jgi:hypothetical protein